MHKFGEGTMRINGATDDMIKAARRIMQKYDLTKEALDVVLERVQAAESPRSLRGTLPSARAIRTPVRPAEEPPKLDQVG